MAGEKGGHHHIDQNRSNRKNGKDMRIDADKRIDYQERDGMGSFAPIEQTLDLVLEREHDANSTLCQYFV